ncbi:MAG: hypothetical protein IJ835_04690 [Muribaculaceae bacterium]|nr:hypothetical protein [Muribaculaceae bacterium]
MSLTIKRVYFAFVMMMIARMAMAADVDLLNGVACELPQVAQKAQVTITAESTAPYGKCLLIDVKYPADVDGRDATYLATYDAAGRLIDCAVAAFTADVALAADERLYEHYGVFMEPGKTLTELTDSALTVTRAYSLGYGNKGGSWHDERGTVVSTFAIGSDGIIASPTHVSRSTMTRQANRSIPDRKPEPDVVTEKNSCSFGPGWNLLNLIMRPKSDSVVPAAYEAYLPDVLLQMLAGGDVPRELRRNEATANRLMASGEWLQRLIYRNPELWLAWLRQNPESKTMKIVDVLLTDDPDFASWLDDAIKRLPDKKLRKWWQKRTKK